MANPGKFEEAGPPGQLPNVTPNVSGESGQTRLLINAIENSVSGIKEDVKEIKSHRHSDFVYTISIFSVGFVLLAGMIIIGFLRIEDRLFSLTTSTVKTETKLEDLIQRIPPVPTPAPRR